MRGEHEVANSLATQSRRIFLHRFGGAVAKNKTGDLTMKSKSAPSKPATLTELVRRRYHRRGNGLLKTEAEIAAALGEKERTIRTWRHSGVIPAVVLGHRTVRYRLDSVIKALERRTVREV